MTDTPLIRCEQLRIGHRGRALLPSLDLSIGGGELWAVVGRNGTGKTTWFRTLLGLLPPVSGRVIRAEQLRVSYVPQRLKLDELFPVLARDVVHMGVERGWSFAKQRASEPAGVLQALERVGAAQLADQSFRALSEGQKQRVLLARLFVARPQLALLDEPTSAMDAVAEREALQLLDALRREQGTTVMVVSHYLGMARELADRMVLFDGHNGSIVTGTTQAVLDGAAFHANYKGTLDDATDAS
jgi:zinc transport system ATP-binding protein